jgi:CheY-like chemotaxis protein
MKSNALAIDADDALKGQAKKSVKSPFSARIASSYAHDSRHQIQVADLSLRSLMKLLDGKEDAKVHAGMALSAVGALKEMMEDMILYIRLGTGEQVPVDMKGLGVGPDLRKIRDTLGPIAEKQGAQLRVRSSRMQIVTDPRSFRRILYNLVDNSIKHARGTKVVVGMRISEDDCVLEVADNGRGIPENEQDRIFEAGFRGSAAGGENWSEGRGLGLFIVRSMVERLGGTITVRSKPGHGARFRVTLPGPIEWQPRGVNAMKHDEASLDGKTIAVLEDHLETLRLYESAFVSRGATVIASDNVAEWVSKVVNAKKIPDLILVDFMIGRGTSDLAITMLRSRLRDAMGKGGKKGGKSVLSLPIVIVTGNPGHPQLKELSKNTPVLQKPLTQQSIETLTQVAAGTRMLNAADFIN